MEKQDRNNKDESPSSLQCEEESMCRLCWGEADAEPGGQLISPCSCSGSLQYIHKRCLLDWQRTLRSQGLGRRALECELCKTTYNTSPQYHLVPANTVPGKLLAHLTQALLDNLVCTSWPVLVLKVWRCYVMANGIVQATRLGASGFTAGLILGRTLIEEQTALLAAILSSMSAFLGSPYAELLWCQAVGALVVGMLSELVYTSVLGLLGGAAYGFCLGYAQAVKGSLRLLFKCGFKLVSGVSFFGLRSIRRLVGAVLHV